VNKRRERFWTILLISAIISAVVSFITTSFGLLHYLSFLLATPLALAVQMGLFGLAWLVGYGERRLRPLMIALYFLTMIFSVIFSYVFLQSELVERVKPLESQRQLFDDIRGRMLSFGNIINEGVNESEIITTRLKMWLDLEEDKGWATKTCEEEKHCYLQDVCSRVRGKIDLWEEKFGQSYREGPGRELIHGALSEEYNTTVQVQNRLREFRDNVWSKSNVLSENIDNRQRLTLFDGIVAGVPKKDLESVLCREVKLPEPPHYEDYARDAVAKEEKQVYAFEDLLDLFISDHRFQRSDYPTVFALGLAIFIDLFVLIVAIGAAVIENRRDEELMLSDSERVRTEWDSRKEDDVSWWVDGALLGQVSEKSNKIEFVREVIKSIIINQEGENVLVPLNEEQFRFGIMIVKSKAASTSQTKIEGQKKTVFILENWVYISLMGYLRSFEKPDV